MTREEYDALTPAQKMDARWKSNHDGMTPEQRQMRYDLTTWIHYSNQDKHPYPADIATRLQEEHYASDQTRQAIMLDIWFVEDFRDGKLSWEILDAH